MRAAPQEIREQIIEAKLRDETTETIILWTKVSKSTIDKVWSRYRKTGSGNAIPYTGRKSRMTPEIESRIRSEIAENSDITLEELIGGLDLPIKKSRLSELLILWGLTYKKRHSIQQDNNEKTCKKNVRIGKKANRN